MADMVKFRGGGQEDRPDAKNGGGQKPRRIPTVAQRSATPAWISNYIDYKVWDELLIYSQTSMVAPLFGNGMSNFK